MEARWAAGGTQRSPRGLYQTVPAASRPVYGVASTSAAARPRFVRYASRLAGSKLVLAGNESMIPCCVARAPQYLARGSCPSGGRRPSNGHGASVSILLFQPDCVNVNLRCRADGVAIQTCVQTADIPARLWCDAQIVGFFSILVENQEGISHPCSAMTG